MYDEGCGLALEPMQWNRASSRVDLGYIKIFRIHVVMSVYFKTCDSVPGDSLKLHQANQGSLRFLLGTRNCSAHNARESGLVSRQGGSFMAFLLLRQEPGVYFRVMAGMAMKDSFLFINVRTPF